MKNKINSDPRKQFKDSKTLSVLLFHSYELEVTNQYSVLAQHDHSTSSSITSPTLEFAPNLWSSPKPPNPHSHRGSSHHTPLSETSKNSTAESTFKLPKKQNNWRSLIVNCQSAFAKSAQLKLATEYTDPRM